MNAAKKAPIIVGIGEILWDMLPGGKRAGGAPINFVYHATQLGAKGYAISSVGKDKNGVEILEELKKNKITYFIEKNDYPTGTVEVKIDGNGIPSYKIIENVAWDHLALTRHAVEIVKKADAICYGTLGMRSENSRKTIESLISHASKDALKFFDVNMRGDYYSKDLIDRLLRCSNVFKLNDDEVKIFKTLFNLQGTDEDICRYILKEYNLKYLIFTAGEKFSTVYSQNEMSHIKTPKVDVVDTVGAGDSFSGAFVYAMLTGNDLKKAHQFAVEIAAFVSTKAGAWPQYE